MSELIRLDEKKESVRFALMIEAFKSYLYLSFISRGERKAKKDGVRLVCARVRCEHDDTREDFRVFAAIFVLFFILG